MLQGEHFRTHSRAHAPLAALTSPLVAAAPPSSLLVQHFVGNELDGWNGTDRNHIDVFIPQQDLVDSYLPSFQMCVEEGKASGIMCS